MIRKSKKAPEPEAPNVPAYIVTFSDMVTLLLTFFVMLLSLAQIQDPELFNKSRDAFNRHINLYGLGILTGRQMSPDFEKNKMKYHIPDPDDNRAARTVDARKETLRRLFQKAAESMQAIPSRVTVRLSDYTPTGIQFAPGQTSLDESAQQYLTQLAAEYQHQLDSKKIKIYVLGLDMDGRDEKLQWVVSSMRAQQVADYLNRAGFRCPIYAWGAGPGRWWTEQDSPISKQSQILIAFVRVND